MIEWRNDIRALSKVIKQIRGDSSASGDKEQKGILKRTDTMGRMKTDPDTGEARFEGQIKPTDFIGMNIASGGGISGSTVTTRAPWAMSGPPPMNPAFAARASNIEQLAEKETDPRKKEALKKQAAKVAEQGRMTGKDCCSKLAALIKVAEDGNKLLAQMESTKEIEEDIILQIDAPYHDQFVNIKTEHSQNTNTFDHPYWSVTKGKWVSYAPGLTEERYNLNDVWELEEGEVLLYLNNGSEIIETKVLSIELGDLQSSIT